MDKTQQELLRLLQGALWGTECDIVTTNELRQVMKLAKAHTVDGFVAGLFMDNKVTLQESADKEDTIMDLAINNAIHRKAYAKHCSVVTELDVLMASHHIPYFVFKGTSVASHYPKPCERSMGDVDFYVLPQDFKRTIESLENEWKVKVEMGESEKHFSFTYKHITFELHHRVETFGSAKHQRLFDKLINDGIEHSVPYKVGGGTALMLPPEENIITVFKHMFNHLLVEGVGLRQVVDVAILLNDCKDDIDISLLREKISKIGYIKAFEATVSMLNDFLCLPCASQYAELSEGNSKWGHKMMDFILESGNFGRRAYRNQSEGIARSTETAFRAFRHLFNLAPLIPSEVPGIIWKHTNITLRKHLPQ